MLTMIAIYELKTGEIKSTGGIQFDKDLKPAQIAAALAPWGTETHCLLEAEGATVDRHYVAILDGTAVLAERPELIVFTEDGKTTLQADGVDTIVLTGLPDPCEIIIDAPDPDVETTITTVTGGGFVFVADDPGTYTVEVRRFPFLPFKIEFSAV